MAAKGNGKSAESLVREIKRKTRRVFGAEEKIRRLRNTLSINYCLSRPFRRLW
jgi:hypothetical protein